MYPLEVAARFGLNDQINLLLDTGADIHHTSHNGWSPLHWAAAGGFSSSVSLLVSRGACINEYTKGVTKKISY